MTVSTFFADTGDGRIIVQDTSYSGAVVSAVGVGTGTSGTIENCGQRLTGGVYTAWELFFAFDTSTIPDTDTVSSVVFSLFSEEDLSTTDFTVEAFIYSFATLTNADWQTPSQLSALTKVATWPSASYSDGVYIDFTSESAFASNINKTGLTELVVASANTRTSTAPTVNEFIAWLMADVSGTGSDPKLVVTHSAVTTTRRLQTNVSPRRW